MKPGPPPPPPSPPRRITSGFGPRSNVAAFAQTALENGANGPGAGDAFDSDDALEASTMAGKGEPLTLDRIDRSADPVTLEPARNPRRGRVDALTYDDETQARPVDDRLLEKIRRHDANAAPRDAQLGVDYESLPSLEVRHPFDTYEPAFSESDPVTQLHASPASAPAYESARVRRAEGSYNEPAVAFEEPVYNDEPITPAYGEREPEQDVWGRREESGPRERPLPPPARSYAAPVPSYDDASDSAQWGRDRAQPPSHRAQEQGWSSIPPEGDDSQLDQAMIPPAPRVPEEMLSGFPVGVQRIRTATPDAWGTPHLAPPQPGQYLPSPMQAIHSSMPPQYAQNQQQYPAYAYQHPYAQHAQHQQAQAQYHQPQPTAYAASPQQYLQPGQRQPTPMPMARASAAMSPMSPSVMDRMQRAQPVGGQLVTQPPAPNGKIGRFAWFVAGAAFGITFAFFATGFFNGAKTSHDDVPVAPAATIAPAATVAPAATAPAALVAPVAPVAPTTQLAAPPVAPSALTPASLPAVAAGVAPAAVVAPPAAAATTAPAARVAPPPPAPRAPRFQAPPPRRPAPPASQGPRNLGGGGAGADDDRPSAPAAPPPGSDLGDLLGAGLKP